LLRPGDRIVMEFKPDWEKVKKRYLAFWQGEILDRVLFSVVVPRKKVPTLPEPKEPEIRFADTEYLIRLNFWRLENTFYLADALPVFPTDCGVLLPDCLFAAEMIYGETVWLKPHLRSSEEILNSKFPDYQHPLLKKQETYYRRVCQLLRGKCFVMRPALTPGLDCLAGVLGTERVCLEMAEDSPSLVQALARINEAWLRLYQQFQEIALAFGVETTDFLPLWGPGKTAVLQCDLANLISPSFFQKFALPGLSFCASNLDRAIFHLHGQNSLRHLPALLDCQWLKVIQWQPGGPDRFLQDAGRWLPLLKQVQAAGKKLYVACRPDQVGPILENLSSRNLFVETTAADIEEACRLERLAFHLTHD